MGENRKLTWFILIRVVLVSLFLVSTIILNIREPDSVASGALTGFTWLIVATYLFSISSLLILKLSARIHPLLTYSQIVWDLLLVTALLILTGGINSPYSFLYLLSVINASVLLARREALYTASLCGILYGGILDLQYYGKLTDLGLSPLPAQQYGATYIFYTIFVNIVAFYLTAFLTGYLAEQLKRSESALQEKAINYAELERLNSSIVSNLNSGLLTINNDNRIRVFNRYAEMLTGISQEKAYDKPLFEVFPGLVEFTEQINSVPRGEFLYQSLSGEKMTIGFKSVSLRNREGITDGVIIVFQDLTQYKRMEEDLKRADRLAAIGELSAHIAHEIRNPLTSISGSVQLIAENSAIDPNDKKLLEIVVRETDRLNGLIRNFLAYARPMQKEKAPVNLGELLGMVQSLLEADTRFQGVTIQNNCPENMYVMADHDQLEQVFWNLLVNAAEAMPQGGVITLGGAVTESPFDRRKMAEIMVADTGAGMDTVHVGKVFEPFFTTKKDGTGLGLATVYRIIEAHGGTIRVESSIGVGTVFIIRLPMKNES